MLVYDYGQMVSGRINNEVNTDIRTHKNKWHQVTQTKSSFHLFPFCRWIICLVRNHSLNLRIFVFRSGYSRKRVKRLQNLQKEHTPKQLGRLILFLSPRGLVLSREKIWLGLEIDPSKSRMLFSQCYKFVYVGTISVYCRKIIAYKVAFHRISDRQCQRLILIHSLGSESRCYLIKLPFFLVFTFLFFWSLIFGSNLDETTRSVYKENVRLNAALDFHLREGQELKKVCFLLHCNLFFAENSNHISLPFCTIYPPLNCSITRV